MMFGLLCTIGIIVIAMLWRHLGSQKQVARETVSRNDEWRNRAQKIRALETTTYTEKQSKRINAIEATKKMNGSYERYYPELAAAKDDELLGVTTIYAGGNEWYWLAIYQDEVLPSKKLSRDFHIYPVARKAFTEYYQIFVDKQSEQKSETQKYTYTPPKASATKRAVAGAVIGGGVGAVVGVATAIDKNSRAPETRYRTVTYSSSEYFLSLQSVFYDKNANLTAPVIRLNSLDVYFDDTTVLKSLVPKAGKDRVRTIDDGENRSLKKNILQIGEPLSYHYLEYEQEKEKAFLYLLNDY